MIITVAEAKTLLQIGDSSKDALLAALIPLIQGKVVRYCNNSFVDTSRRATSSGIAFVAGSPATITDTNAGFVAAGLSATDDIVVTGSHDNDGIYGLSIVQAGTLTLASGLTLLNEAAGWSITISRVAWPSEIKLPVSILLGYFLAKQGKLVSQESLPGGYSATFKSETEVMSLFNDFRKLYR
jgi:hypothetical protein